MFGINCSPLCELEREIDSESECIPLRARRWEERAWFIIIEWQVFVHCNVLYSPRVAWSHFIFTAVIVFVLNRYEFDIVLLLFDPWHFSFYFLTVSTIKTHIKNHLKLFVIIWQQ